MCVYKPIKLTLFDFIFHVMSSRQIQTDDRETPSASVQRVLFRWRMSEYFCINVAPKDHGIILLLSESSASTHGRRASRTLTDISRLSHDKKSYHTHTHKHISRI